MNIEILDNQNSANENSSFSPQTMSELSSLGQWLKITAILSFVQLPITLITSIKSGNYTNLFAVVVGTIFAFILLNAAIGLQAFCRNPNSFDLAKFGGNIRNYYLIIGIFCVIALAISFLFVLIGVIAAL